MLDLLILTLLLLAPFLLLILGAGFYDHLPQKWREDLEARLALLR